MNSNDKNNQSGSYLKRELEDRNITQKQLQDDLGVSQQYISAIISGKKSVGKKMAKKLSELYDLDESKILFGSVSPFVSGSYSIQTSINTIKNKPHDDQMEILFNEVSDVERKIDRSTATLLARQDIQDRDVVILKKKIDEQNRTLLEIKDMLQMVLKNI